LIERSDLGSIKYFINPSPKKVTICASEAKPKQRGEAPVCTRNTIAKGKGDEED
jgi:hypothetical protein